MNGRLLTLFFCVISFTLPDGLASQSRWTWMMHATEVDTSQPAFFDLVLGVSAHAVEDTGRLGNLNVRGTVSADLFGFDATLRPHLFANHLADYEMTATAGPMPQQWQLNSAYRGAEGEGAVVDTAGIAVATIRFYIRNLGGWSTVDFDTIQQTYADDNMTRVLAAYDTTGGDVRLVAEDTGVFSDASVPDRFALFQNYPNPLNPATVIAYQVPNTCEVALKIFNVMGEEIRTLLQESRRAGRHTIVWDGTDGKGLRVPSGVYFIRMRAGPHEEIRKMTVLY